jgi:hypothetical protein
VPGYRDTDRELARFALDAWSRESGGVITFSEAGAARDAQIRVRWVSSGGGAYGETEYVRVNGKPGAIVNVMPDASLQGEPLAGMATADQLLRDTIVYLTCVHELGHAVGLQHTRNAGDIMFYFGYGDERRVHASDLLRHLLAIAEGISAERRASRFCFSPARRCSPVSQGGAARRTHPGPPASMCFQPFSWPRCTASGAGTASNSA